VERQCEEYADYCIIAGDPGYADIINTTGMIRTMERTLMDIMTDEPSTQRFIDRRLDVQLEIARRTLEAGKGRIDVFWLGEDLGTQRGPMISGALYDAQFRERHQRFIDVGREYGALVMFHSCGSSSWVFDRWIEMGVEIIDTLQPEAVNMEPDYLKATYGDRLAFHGCISTAGPVAYGTPDDTVKNVRDTLATMMPGGGYALAPTHLLQDNSPVENVVAMFEAALEYGVYR
jgi:uroporphyrinogen decarboxylase